METALDGALVEINVKTFFDGKLVKEESRLIECPLDRAEFFELLDKGGLQWVNAHPSVLRATLENAKHAQDTIGGGKPPMYISRSR